MSSQARSVRTLSASGVLETATTKESGKQNLRSRYYDHNITETLARMQAYQKHKVKLS